MIYLLTKDYTQLAFEGPEEPIKTPELSDEQYVYLFKKWEYEMGSAIKSSLVVVNPELVLDYEPDGMFLEGDVKLSPGETIPLPGWGLEKVLQKRWGTEWHDLPGQTEGREPEGIYRTVCRLKRSEPVKQPITLTFKLGSLWHGEYQVVNPEVIPGVINSKGTLKHDFGECLALVDGDELTLPEGYGIETMEKKAFIKLAVPYRTV